MVVPINRNYRINHMCHVFKSFHNSRLPSRDFPTKGQGFPRFLPGKHGNPARKSFQAIGRRVSSSAAGASLRPQSGLPPEETAAATTVTLSFQRGNPCLKIENRCGTGRRYLRRSGTMISWSRRISTTWPSWIALTVI